MSQALQNRINICDSRANFMKLYSNKRRNLKEKDKWAVHHKILKHAVPHYFRKLMWLSINEDA
jgi:hypothetical protein